MWYIIVIEEENEMKYIYLLNYSVKGIKSIEDLVSLSFYKKTITKNPDTQEYNIKGIYGMNGSGKTGIITAMDILKNIILSPGYLNNPVVQKNLEEIINKKTKELFIEVEYLVPAKRAPLLFQYNLTLSKDSVGKYVISREQLSSKKATSKGASLERVFEIFNGKVLFISDSKDDGFNDILIENSVNLLSSNSMSSLFYEKILVNLFKSEKKYRSDSILGLILLLFFALNVHVYLDSEDNHRDFLVHNLVWKLDDILKENAEISASLRSLFDMDYATLKVISAYGNTVSKSNYKNFEEKVRKLYDFISIFKSELRDIQIDRKEDKDDYVCNLVMVYDSYSIYAEFESTGIKKLIKLFEYLTEMVQGGIVFIDEFDSNLHDVYLCALLEYLMEYGEGQLCFTTHNVGPMDVLRRHKMSIDFLSEDNKIYPWKKNGNYSPAKLYRNGMIEGSPFNVDSTDFIGVFGSTEEE